MDRITPSQTTISKVKVEKGSLYSVLAEFPLQKIKKSCCVDGMILVNTVITQECSILQAFLHVHLHRIKQKKNGIGWKYFILQHKLGNIKIVLQLMVFQGEQREPTHSADCNRIVCERGISFRSLEFEILQKTRKPAHIYKLP